ncbi:HlyD family secretion protein [Alkalibacillus flavidus]|uniref:HlyD family secretion protein n=1 Tax=Alkalibacillus flavidus TaxID=546021 RepID=A0ABV2KU06_9BACI
MQWKRWLFVMVGLFVLVNSCLIFFDSEARVERKSNVSEWTEISQRYMEETLTERAMMTASEQRVYFDKRRGEFEEFFVEKSDSVSVGDPLYAYQVTDYAETERRLSSEISQLNDEISRIEDLIQEMEFYTIPENSSESSFSVNDGEYEIDLPSTEPIESEYQKEQFITELERDLAVREAKRDSAENQLDELESTGETITVTSPYEGVVEEISPSLGDPLVTILGDEKVAMAKLSDDQQKQVEQGMATRVNDVVDGEVARVNDVPETFDGDKPARYALNATLNGNADRLLLGEKVELDVILDASENASVVREDHLVDTQLPVITGEGGVSLVDVRTGIHMDGWIEIADMPPGIHYATEPEERFRHQTPLTTRFDAGEMAWLDMFDFAKQTPLLKGLLYR